jgi:fatty-acyl-CoA synthase
MAGIPLLLALVIALGLRLGLINWRSGLADQTLDWPYRFALVGLVGGLLAMFAALFAGFGRFWRRALFSLLAPLAIMAGLVWLSVVQQSYPPVHDVATDWTDPILFSPALMATRGSAANPVEPDPVIPADGGRYMNRRVAEVNADTCPQAHPVVLPLLPPQAYAKVKAAVQHAGLTLLNDDPVEGLLEASRANLLFGLRNDLAVRIKAQGPDSRVDLRSSSREAASDFGANCALVSGLVKAIAGR